MYIMTTRNFEKNTFENNFWQDVMATFRKLPFRMIIAWMLAPPMALLVVIAWILMATDRFTQMDMSGTLVR
jgi:uncharacterized membrane protein